MPSSPSAKRAFSFAAAQALLRGLARLGLRLFHKLYALALMALIIWVSWQAVRYLIVSLVTPSAVPAQISGLPLKLDEVVLQGMRPDWLGMSAVENPRGPLAHYHRFESWTVADRFNDCARSGCHSPLPHTRSKELRAFLNMHATSMHCGVCHMQAEPGPLPLTWYRLADGVAGDPPPLLRAYGWLTEREVAGRTAKPPTVAKEEFTPADQHAIVSLLRSASLAAPGEPHLARIARNLAAPRAGSDEFVQLLHDALKIVEREFRGAYGAKLARLDPASGRPILGHPDTELAVSDWLARGRQADPATREELLAAVHPLRRAEALTCTACHVQSGGLVNFAALGYPPARVRKLFQPELFEMIENIAAGRPFYLPTFTVPATAPPTTRPAAP